MLVPPTFRVALRGYDRAQVDALVDHAMSALDTDDPAARTRAAAIFQEAEFSLRFRGYDITEVDDFIDEVRAKLRS